jgi:hypothetical protein
VYQGKTQQIQRVKPVASSAQTQISIADSCGYIHNSKLSPVSVAKVSLASACTQVLDAYRRGKQRDGRIQQPKTSMRAAGEHLLLLPSSATTGRTDMPNPPEHIAAQSPVKHTCRASTCASLQLTRVQSPYADVSCGASGCGSPEPGGAAAGAAAAEQQRKDGSALLEAAPRAAPLCSAHGGVYLLLVLLALAAVPTSRADGGCPGAQPSCAVWLIAVLAAAWQQCSSSQTWYKRDASQMAARSCHVCHDCAARRVAGESACVQAPSDDVLGGRDAVDSCSTGADHHMGGGEGRGGMHPAVQRSTAGPLAGPCVAPLPASGMCKHPAASQKADTARSVLLGSILSCRQPLTQTRSTINRITLTQPHRALQAPTCPPHSATPTGL